MSEKKQLKAFVITALSKEFIAVSNHLENIRVDKHPTGSLYEHGQFEGKNCNWDIWIVEAGVGNERTAMEVERGLQYLCPDITIFCGVAGGVKDVKLGDIVFANKVYGYESGKALGEFSARPDLFHSDSGLLHSCRYEARAKNWFSRTGLNLKNIPDVKEGPIAAGEKVVASRKAEVALFLYKHYGDTLAVEMEGHGHMLVAHSNQTPAIVIRGISDLLAEKSLSDSQGWQEKAMNHAAAFMFELLSNFEPVEKNQLDPSLISWEAIHTTLNSMHRHIEMDYSPDIVLTMSGPGSFAACYCMSLNPRNVPVVFATTFPKSVSTTEQFLMFKEIAEICGWNFIETKKWLVFLPNTLLNLPKSSKILLFDDRVLTGETQKKAKQLIEQHGYQVRCAAMLVDEKPPSFIDYWGRIITGDFYMPWGTKYGRI